MLLRMILIIVIASAAAAVYQPLAPRFGGATIPPFPDRKALSEVERLRNELSVSQQEMLEMIDYGAVVIDARPAEEFAKAHLDAPLIINIPESHKESHVHKLVPGFRYVIYCSSLTCDAAVHLVQYLAPYGFGEMRIFNPGWAGIVEAGLPTTDGPESDLTGGMFDPAAPPPSMEAPHSIEPPADAADQPSEDSPEENAGATGAAADGAAADGAAADGETP